MTALRQRMLEDMQIRNLSPKTIDAYLFHVASFARHFGRSPAELGPEAVLQVLLGHASLKTTTVYLHVSRKLISAVTSPLDTLTLPS
jgi:site-specific recombinase XerD